jgi:hypothetical protein
MKPIASLIIILLLIVNNLNSQKAKLPIDYRFKNGELGFTSFFSKNIKYPKQSIQNGTIANSITRISVNPKGEIDTIYTLNPIDSIIDLEVNRVINLSRNLWKECDSIEHDHVFYIQIAFSLSKIMPNTFNPRSNQLMKLFPNPIIITLPEPLIKSPDNEQEPKIIIPSNESLAKKLNSSLVTSDFGNALPLLNELIKRDPFNRELYQVRIMINIKSGKSELASADDNKLFDFAEGFSLTDINKDQYLSSKPDN